MGPGGAEVLARVRSALGSAREDVEVPREYAHAVEDDVDVVALFAERAADYRAVVRRVAGDGGGTAAAAAVGQALRELGAASVVVPDDLPAELLSQVDGVVLRDRGDLTVDALDRVDAVLTGCAVAVAETGTIVLDAGTGQGRRALSLVPDAHVCVVRAGQVVGTVPEAVAATAGADVLTWVSGPSATSDIELHRVEGVHGPRTLVIVLVD
ncbi:LUD domain-containing protein [Actinokineospora auranticolor]|nr:LUD domain-containing protein [Actinokineospora auranticolor]